MNIEIVGRHALLFDDDTTSAFVNSDDALVEWHSLLIDRYDVRHLLSSPPPSRRRRNPHTSHTSSADAEIDYERYLDLLSASEEQEAEAEANTQVQPEPVGGFNAVPFSYGNYEDSNDQKNVEIESEGPRFHPPFHVPDNLVQNLPPTEKVHQIIARTALFVSKNGGQSEIVLRVKQGDNPTFGFLMPHHHLHPYFRFLIDHQDLLQPKNDDNNEEKTSGALSLLGSLYGNGEDDDGETVNASSSSINVDATAVLASGKTTSLAGKDESISKHLFHSNKEDSLIIRKNSLPNTLKGGRTNITRKGESLNSLSVVPDKLRASSLPPIPKTEQMLLDPPSEMKRLVEKIVEFIMKNGRQFEAVLMEQDRDHGRFPFLIPSNKFHPYYLKALQKAQESKLSIKNFHNEKEDFRGRISNKKTSTSRETQSSVPESDDIPLDSERKEKFKMVINKSKKEASDLPTKPPQEHVGIQVDAAQAAAILQAATRGIKLPNLGFLSNLSVNGQPSNSSQRNDSDSSEANMTEEQKLKAERLKRAKMFVAKLKSGSSSNPLKTEEPLRDSLSDGEVLDKRVQLEKKILDEEKRAKRKYRGRSSRDEELEASETQEEEEEMSHKHHSKKHGEEKDEKRRHKSHRTSDKHEEKDDKYSKKKKHRYSSDYEDDEYSRKKHRSHHSLHDDDDDDEEKDHKYSRKKKHRSSSEYYEDEEHSRKNHQSHRFSYDDADEDHARKKHRSHHSSHDDDGDEEKDHKYSRKKKHHHRSSSDYEDDEEYSRKKKHHEAHSSHEDDDADEDYKRKKHRSHKSSKHKHRKSHSSRHKRKDASSEENSLKEDMEEEETSSKISKGQTRGGVLVNGGVSREASVDVSSQPCEITEVPDDLRAKIRAMLMSTM